MTLWTFHNHSRGGFVDHHALVAIGTFKQDVTKSDDDFWCGLLALPWIHTEPRARDYAGTADDLQATGLASVLTAESSLRNLIYEGAGHGFLRAAKQAWPATIAFLREHTK